VANGFLEGNAPALPKNFRRIRSGLEGWASARPQNFGTSGDVPSSLFSLLSLF